MRSQKDNKRALLNGTIIYAMGNIGTKIISFLIVPLYTYYIAPGDMGDYDLLNTTVALLTPLMTMRISDAAYRWMLHSICPKKDCISATYRIIILSAFFYACIILGVNYFFPIKYCYYFIGMLVFGRVLDSMQTLLRGLSRQRLYALTGVLYTMVYVTLNLVKIVCLHQGIEALMQSTIISQIITIIIILSFEPKLRTRIFLNSENRKLTNDMLKYSAPLVPSGLSWWIMGASDRYVVRYFLGRTATGIYSVANKFPSIMSVLFSIFNYSWTDVALSNLKEGEETSEYTSKVFKQLYEISFSFTILLIPMTKIVIDFLLSESYKISAQYISFLYLGSIFQGFTAFISVGLLQGTNTKAVAKSSIIGAIANLLIDILAIRFLGIYAASISTFIGFFVMWLYRMKDIKNVSPIRINIINFSIFLIFSIIIAIVTIWTNNTTDFILSTIALVFFIVHNKAMLFELLKKS